MGKAFSPTSRKPVIYLYLYNKLVEKYGHRPIELDLKDIISSNKIIIFHIPTKHQYPIVQEMVHYGLLKKINNMRYELVVANYDKIVEPINTYFIWD